MRGKIMVSNHPLQTMHKKYQYDAKKEIRLISCEVH